MVRELPRPQPGERWRLRQCDALDPRQLSGRVLLVAFVHKANDPACSWVVGTVGRRKGVTVRITHLAHKVEQLDLFG